MFESSCGVGPGPVDPTDLYTLHAGLTNTTDWLATLTTPADGPHVDRARIDAIRALEDLKNAAAGLQAQLAADFAASQTAAQRAAGVHRTRLGRGVAVQIGLARRESPHRATTLLGLANALAAEMPHTLAALRAGVISEWAATGLAAETACLTRTDRTRVDAEVAGDLAEVERLGARGARHAAARLAARLDPASVVERRRRAETDRHVSLRPAPDTMTRFSALLPVKDGVAAYTALTRAADAARATGDPRTRGQVMADTLVDTLLVHADDNATQPAEPTETAGPQPTAEPERAPARERGPRTSRVGQFLPWPPPEAPEVPAPSPQATRPTPGVTLNLVMTDAQLFGVGPDSEGDAWLEGAGPIDADLARQMAKTSPSGQTWLRRLYTRPDDGALVSMDSRRRLFPQAMKDFIRIRDQVCRTPWCSAPIRHIDHATDHADGGATSIANGQGLCEACNHAKQAPGWHARANPDDSTLTITTPTGHEFTTRPPPLPGRPPHPTPRIDYLYPPGIVLEWQPDAA